jgi:hypothetical protein
VRLEGGVEGEGEGEGEGGGGGEGEVTTQLQDQVSTGQTQQQQGQSLQEWTSWLRKRVKVTRKNSEKGCGVEGGGARDRGQTKCCVFVYVEEPRSKTLLIDLRKTRTVWAVSSSFFFKYQRLSQEIPVFENGFTSQHIYNIYTTLDFVFGFLFLCGTLHYLCYLCCLAKIGPKWRWPRHGVFSWCIG